MQPDARATPVEAKKFPQVAHQTLLSTDRSVEERLQLAGVVQYQLSRAERLFEKGYEKAAEDTATGALLLLRADDPIDAALAGQDHALLLAAHAAARRGDAGRAQAFYERVLELSSDESVQKDVREHLKAMASWELATQGETPLSRAGHRVRHTLARATVDPSRQAYQEAQQATIAWMKAALDSSALSRNPESMGDREEALEAYRAIRTGAPALMALSLRQGEPLQALELLTNADLTRALPNGAQELLVDAGKKNNPEAWLQLFRLMDSARRNPKTEANLPAYLSDAGALWAAIKTYRASPGELKYAMPLSMMLLEFGLPEVATTLLAQTVGPKTSPEALAWSLSLILRAMLELGETDQIKAARMAFSESRSLLDLAGEKLPEDTESSRSLHRMLANLEIRLGHTKRALPLLKQASRKSTRPATWIRLAEVQHQVSGAEQALATLDQASQIARSQGDVLAEAHIAELRFVLLRTRQASDQAARALEIALKRTLTARAMALPQTPDASVERLLARILEHYGERRATHRAYARALSASGKNLSELTYTLTDMARSALATGDVRMARKATQRALDLNIKSEDLIYIALWHALVEQRQGGKQDQLPSVALSMATDASGWPALLRRFGLGQIDAASLLRSAEGKIQETEALFYSALTSQEPQRRKEELEKVAKSPAIDLVEVQLARDLLAPEKEWPLPQDVNIP